MSGNVFQLVDAFNGYYLYYGEEAVCVGDGCDRESEFEIGTEEFRAEWEEEFNFEKDLIIEAYFS